MTAFVNVSHRAEERSSWLQLHHKQKYSDNIGHLGKLLSPGRLCYENVTDGC